MPLDLYQINLRAFGGEQLSREELAFAVDLVSSTETDKAITAFGILFMAGDSEQRSSALDRLREICRAGKQHESKTAQAALVAILEFLPKEELHSNPSYREFAYRMAKSPFLPTRINVMRVLRQFGRMGDRRAIALLNEATTDSDPFVKQGAETALRLVGEADKK